ncbi:MAG: amidohydrolase family protein [Ferruginibacter sp.]|nr:amidohydrolase family protein [Ferruginibacter sp.]
MYRKFTADHIFTGYEILSSPTVLITDPLGVIIDIVDKKHAGDGVENLRGLLTPGFTNAHCHLELSHLKGMIPQKTGLVEFVQKVMSIRAASGELKLEAMVNAEAEMYKNGIVAVGDICNTTDSIPAKAESKLRWHNFIELSGFTDAVAQQRLDDMEKVYQQFMATNPRQRTSFSPHAPYSVSKKLFQLLNEATAGQIITIHNQESPAEDDLYRHKNGEFLALYKNFGIDFTAFEPTGKSSFQSWLPYFTNSQSIISVHNTFTGIADIAFSQSHLKENNSGLFYCICINANKYIEQKIPSIRLLMKSNFDIVIGTDSYASNLQLNILEEIKTIQRETNYEIPLQELLKWATINGARALQLHHTSGSFEKGKQPGVVLVEGLDNLQTTQHSFARRIL